MKQKNCRLQYQNMLFQRLSFLLLLAPLPHQVSARTRHLAPVEEFDDLEILMDEKWDPVVDDLDSEPVEGDLLSRINGKWTSRTITVGREDTIDYRSPQNGDVIIYSTSDDDKPHPPKIPRVAIIYRRNLKGTEHVHFGGDLKYVMNDEWVPEKDSSLADGDALVYLNGKWTSREVKAKAGETFDIGPPQEGDVIEYTDNDKKKDKDKDKDKSKGDGKDPKKKAVLPPHIPRIVIYY